MPAFSFRFRISLLFDAPMLLGSASWIKHNCIAGLLLPLMFHVWLIVALINKKKCHTNADRINSRRRVVSEEKSGGSYDYMQIKFSVACFFGWVFFFVFEWSDPFMSNSVQQSQIKLGVLGHCRQAVQLEQKKKKTPTHTLDMDSFNPSTQILHRANGVCVSCLHL